jgi:hypothetical protein
MGPRSRSAAPERTIRHSGKSSWRPAGVRSPGTAGVAQAAVEVPVLSAGVDRTGPANCVEPVRDDHASGPVGPRCRSAGMAARWPRWPRSRVRLAHRDGRRPRLRQPADRRPEPLRLCQRLRDGRDLVRTCGRLPTRPRGGGDGGDEDRVSTKDSRRRESSMAVGHRKFSVRIGSVHVDVSKSVGYFGGSPPSARVTAPTRVRWFGHTATPLVAYTAESRLPQSRGRTKLSPSAATHWRCPRWTEQEVMKRRAGRPLPVHRLPDSDRRTRRRSRTSEARTVCARQLASELVDSRLGSAKMHDDPPAPLAVLRDPADEYRSGRQLVEGDRTPPLGRLGLDGDDLGARSEATQINELAGVHPPEGLDHRRLSGALGTEAAHLLLPLASRGIPAEIQPPAVAHSALGGPSGTGRAGSARPVNRTSWLAGQDSNLQHPDPKADPSRPADDDLSLPVPLSRPFALGGRPHGHVASG